jgi:putative membrane protein
MTNRNSDDTLRPQVMVKDLADDRRTDTTETLSPRVTETAQMGRILHAPAEPQLPVLVAQPPKRRRWKMKLAVSALAAAICAWLAIDLYLWVSAAFTSGAGIGWAAAATVILGLTAAGAMIAHEMRSYLALKTVEANQQRLALQLQGTTHSEARDAIRNVIAEIALDDKTRNALETFQRQVQPHHSAAQQIEIFAQTVMTPLDRRAEAVVRRATTRAFGITVVSPTAITDAVFFIAVSVRMVREIAACYGHRPSTLATLHLLRRLVVEAGKLGVVDFAGATLTQYVGGAVLERVATSAAESMYAAQRMARLGLVTMSMCRPVPFRENELPGIMSSLIGNLFTRSDKTP